MIAEIQSLAHLRAQSNKDPRYKKLAILVAEQMGYKPNNNLDEAIRQLRVEANDTSEDEVVEEINFLRSEIED